MLHRETEHQQMSNQSSSSQGKGSYQESSGRRFENGNNQNHADQDDLMMVVCADDDDEGLQLEPDFPSPNISVGGSITRDPQRDNQQDAWALSKKLESLTAEHNSTREILVKTKSDLLDTIKTLEVTKKAEADLRSYNGSLKKQMETMRANAKDNDYAAEV